MHIGIDLDNTIIRYDDLIDRIARQRGWIEGDAPMGKRRLRDRLRSLGQEDQWTLLQGEIYGPRILEASPFPGVVDTIRDAITAGHEISIISHKTPYPYLGPRHDLRGAALGWLERHGIFAAGLARERVWLEDSADGKIARIAMLSPDVFVDDLPEFLGRADWPQHVRGILFGPDAEPDAPQPALTHWSRFFTHDLDEEQLVAWIRENSPGKYRGYGDSEVRLARLRGGKNHRVYRVDGVDGISPAVLKVYHRNDPEQASLRCAAEMSFLALARSGGIRSIPAPLAWDADQGFALMEFVDGDRPSEVTASHLRQVLEFLSALARLRNHPSAQSIGPAREACFSWDQHRQQVQARVDRLARGVFEAAPRAEQAVAREAAAFVEGQIVPLWNRIQEQLPVGDDALPRHRRCLSPSDLGFHNTLVDTGGRLHFLDFEYAGWDDPAKLVCDFLCQPEVPIPAHLAPGFARAAVGGSPDPEREIERIEQLRPLFEIKWCCILLNDFLPAGDRHRRFALGPQDPGLRRRRQLNQAKALLKGIHP